ncbi:BatA domain-containing protein, partial [Oharaeibacter diazotrophicus]
MTGLPLAFATPWVLVGLAALPVLWWLLRVTPPRPETVTFPPLRLLAEVRVEEETPARTPWWLTAIRLLAAAAVIFALAGPVFRPAADRLTGTGPVWLIVDNGFSAAPDWAARLRTAETVIDGAREAGRTVVLVATADGTDADVVARTADDAAR